MTAREALDAAHLAGWNVRKMPLQVPQQPVIDEHRRHHAGTVGGARLLRHRAHQPHQRAHSTFSVSSAASTSPSKTRPSLSNLRVAPGGLLGHRVAIAVCCSIRSSCGETFAGERHIAVEAPPPRFVSRRAIGSRRYSCSPRQATRRGESGAQSRGSGDGRLPDMPGGPYGRMHVTGVLRLPARKQTMSEVRPS